MIDFIVGFVSGIISVTIVETIAFILIFQNKSYIEKLIEIWYE